MKTVPHARDNDCPSAGEMEILLDAVYRTPTLPRLHFLHIQRTTLSSERALARNAQDGINRLAEGHRCPSLNNPKRELLRGKGAIVIDIRIDDAPGALRQAPALESFDDRLI